MTKQVRKAEKAVQRWKNEHAEMSSKWIQCYMCSKYAKRAGRRARRRLDRSLVR